MAVNKKQLLGEKIIGELKKCGITHIVWLPCYQLSFIYEAMMRQNEIALVPVCREGEGVAVAMARTAPLKSLNSHAYRISKQRL